MAEDGAEIRGWFVTILKSEECMERYFQIAFLVNVPTYRGYWQCYEYLFKDFPPNTRSQIF